MRFKYKPSLDPEMSRKDRRRRVIGEKSGKTASLGGRARGKGDSESSFRIWRFFFLASISICLLEFFLSCVGGLALSLFKSLPDHHFLVISGTCISVKPLAKLRYLIFIYF
jgi:hypothetical protein